MRISKEAIFPRSSWSGIIRRPVEISGLCLILDQECLRIPPLQALQEALEAGVRFFQYRSKINNRREIYHVSLVLARTAAEAGALFLVNDYADIAAAVNADGVHLGQDDLPLDAARRILGPGKVIGMSTHSTAQATAAWHGGADYIGYGPVFATATKDAGALQGLGGIRSVRRAVPLPVVAIGGLDKGNVGAVIEAGADGVALISAILSAPDLKTAAAEVIHSIPARRG